MRLTHAPNWAGLATRVVASIIVIVGIGYFAIFLALVVDGVQEKLDSLKHGHSPVVERGHTVLLGWSDEATTIIRELCMANESLGGGCIAVLCERSKRAMEAELAALIKPSELLGTRVVFRSGSRLRSSDLRKVCTEMARSVIVTSDAKLEPHAADAEVLQVVLNLSTLQTRFANVVAEVRMSENEALLHLISQGTVAAVSSHDLCGALMLEFARQPGLNSVYSQVLGFHGAEFYIKRWPELDGRTFGDLATVFPDAVPVGIIAGTGECEMNPPRDRVLGTGDALVVLAEDDDSYAPQLEPPMSSPRKVVPPEAPCFVPASSALRTGPECVLLAGWRRDVPTMLLLLERQVAPGSELHILSTLPVEKRMREIAEAGVDVATLTRLTVVHHVGNSAVRRYLEELPLERFTSAIIGADTTRETHVIRSDSQSLATLLLVRGIQAARRRRAGSTSYATFAALRAAEILEAGNGLKAPIPPMSPLESEDSFIRGGGSLHGGLTQRRVMQHNGTAFGLAGDVIQSSNQLPIVVEILDPRTQRTVSDSHASGLNQVSDFMNSNDLVSKILAMVSEDAKVKCVLDQLLGGYGTQFAVVPAEQIVQPDEQVSFDELALHCSVVRRSVLCGYITPRRRRSPSECILNPADKATPRSWTACGLVLIVADAERLPHAAASPVTPVYVDRAYSGRLSTGGDGATPTSTLSRAASLLQMSKGEDESSPDVDCFEFDERPRAEE